MNKKESKKEKKNNNEKEEECVQNTKYYGSYKSLGLYTNKPEYNIEKIHILIDDDKLAPFYNGLSDYADNPCLEEESENKNDSVIITITNCDDDNTIVYNKNKKLTNKKSIDLSEVEIKEEIKTPSSAIIDIDVAKINKISNNNCSSSSGSSSSSTLNKNIPNKYDISNENDISNSFDNKLSKETIFKYPILCPICYMYYPRNINYSSCCDQPICTECFTQIKRIITKPNEPENSKIANCPYCAKANFGIYYISPDSEEYKEQYEILVKAKELNDPEYQKLITDESSPGKRKKDLTTLKEEQIVTSENIYSEWFQNKITERQQQIQSQEERTKSKNSALLWLYFAIYLILIIIDTN